MVLSIAACTCIAQAEPVLYPNPKEFTQQDAARMMKAASGALAPVYAPLAEQIVADLDLADKKGIGIDLGSGPGTLIIELCRRTRLYWINADINTHFFPEFFKAATEAGVGDRVGAVFADAQALPFHDNYATVIVSRGSFQFWEDKSLAFSEIYRVLKPGGMAYVGRGFSKNLSVEVARKVRARQKKGNRSGPPPYDVEETERELRSTMRALGIENYTIHKPKPPGSEGINYGIWIKIRK